jgi:hypothetical protein
MVLTRSQKAAIQFALKHAKCEKASFAPFDPKVTIHDLMEPERTLSADEYIKERIRLYMETWVIGPLENLLEHENDPKVSIIDWGV